MEILLVSPLNIVWQLSDHDAFGTTEGPSVNSGRTGFPWDTGGSVSSSEQLATYF